MMTPPITSLYDHPAFDAWPRFVLEVPPPPYEHSVYCLCGAPTEFSYSTAFRNQQSSHAEVSADCPACGGRWSVRPAAYPADVLKVIAVMIRPATASSPTVPPPG